MRAASDRIRAHPGVAAGVVLVAAVFVGGLLWAKWVPYATKVVDLARTHQWPGADILTVGGVRSGDAPTWPAATTFFTGYVGSIWPALLVALLLSAGVAALLPPWWLPRVLNRRRPITSALAGGAASMPSMMCTCCAAPVAATLHRTGVTPAAATAYWLGNPLLNPAVLVFLLLVAPWQWSVTRFLVGVAAVVAIATLVAAVADRRGASPAAAVTAPDFQPSGTRFLAALGRMCLVLLPEYALLILLIGACRGWLLTLSEPAHHGLLMVVVASVVGTLLVLPTAGEIPILHALTLLGASSAVLGALLITLPAVSLPGAVMVARSFGWRMTATVAAAVMAAGLVGAAVLGLLTGIR
ncbi:permease [Mycobacterium sp. PS03-16]|uniref:permease n=1 Tax=Mycobacterium sp. PS03-16 TaxID=2559611 RepID=UPI001FD7558D|nr:permease [Mycobacterium sp. PS03-16]